MIKKNISSLLLNINAKHFLILLNFLFYSFHLSSQVDDINKIKSQSLDPLKINTTDVYQDETFNLPSLETLIDSALVHSPLLLQTEAELQNSNIELQRTKLRWTEYISPVASYKYGTSESYMYSQEGKVTASTVAQNHFNVGVGVNFTIFDLLDRKYQRLTAENNVQIAKNKKEEMIQSIRKDIILLYNNVLLQQRLLAIKNETEQAKMLHFNLAEKQFLDGELSIADYSKIIEVVAKSSADYETCKVGFKNAYMLLEEAVGVKISDIKATSGK